jgi:hypothetical protein
MQGKLVCQFQIKPTSEVSRVSSELATEYNWDLEAGNWKLFFLTIVSAMLRTSLYSNPENVFVHDAILDSCRRHTEKTALVDTSCGRRLTYAEYGDIVERLARGMIAAGLKPGEVVAIFLCNSWEFCAAYHAATLADAIPTLLNPSYREREVRYQLQNSGAALLITDGGNIGSMNLSGLPNLRRVFCTREQGSGAEPFCNLLQSVNASLRGPTHNSQTTLAALPYSSGTTGLPKGVMLSHYNLIANVYQFLGPGATPLTDGDNILCFLPLYHIYGLNVILNPALILGATLVLLPRFSVEQIAPLVTSESITMMPLVPPAMKRALPRSSGRAVSQGSSGTLGEMWGRSARSGPATAIHSADRNPGLPGIRHDRGLARHACWLSRAGLISSGFHRAPRGADGLQNNCFRRTWRASRKCLRSLSWRAG